MESEIILDLADWDRISFTCPKCKTEITFSVGGANSDLPTRCGTCDNQASFAVDGELRQFIRAYRDARDMARHQRIRLRSTASFPGLLRALKQKPKGE